VATAGEGAGAGACSWSAAMRLEARASSRAPASCSAKPPCWCATGASRRERCARDDIHASSRHVFDRPIGKNQGIQFPIATAYAHVRAAADHAVRDHAPGDRAEARHLEQRSHLRLAEHLLGRDRGEHPDERLLRAEPDALVHTAEELHGVL